MSTKRNIQPFFPHSANSRNEDNLIRLRIAHGAAGYGVYFMLMERLRQSDNYECELDLDVLAFDLRENESLIESVICDFDLFEIDDTDHGTIFRNKELSSQMQRMEEQRLRRQEAARKAAAARWEAVRREEADKLGIPYEEYIERFVKPEYIEQPISENNTEKSDIASQEPEKEAESKKQNSTLEKEIVGMMKDSEWIGAIKEQHKLNEMELADKLRQFQSSCKCEGKKGHKDIRDAQSHFSRWLMKLKAKPTNSTPEKGNKTTSDQAFLKATAESNRKMEEARREREKEEAERASRNLQNRLKIIEMGYDPDKHRIWNVMNAQWREKNPPEKKNKS